jgi:hypothetical protein
MDESEIEDENGLDVAVICEARDLPPEPIVSVNGGSSLGIASIRYFLESDVEPVVLSEKTD